MSSSPLSDKEKEARLELLKKQRVVGLKSTMKADLRRLILHYISSQEALDLMLDKALHVERTPLLIEALEELVADLKSTASLIG